jgi:hypothetical protein
LFSLFVYVEERQVGKGYNWWALPHPTHGRSCCKGYLKESPY